MYNIFRERGFKKQRRKWDETNYKSFSHFLLYLVILLCFTAICRSMSWTILTKNENFSVQCNREIRFRTRPFMVYVHKQTLQKLEYSLISVLCSHVWAWFIKHLQFIVITLYNSSLHVWLLVLLSPNFSSEQRTLCCMTSSI